MEDPWLPHSPAADEDSVGLVDRQTMSDLLARCWDDNLSTASNLEIIGHWLHRSAALPQSLIPD